MSGFDQLPAFMALERAGVSVRPLTYVYHEHGGTPDAAAQLRVREHTVLKTLVFRNGLHDSGFAGDPGGNAPVTPGVIAIMHGDRLVSVRKLERASGVSYLVPASFTEAVQLTGLTPGGIGPFGLVTTLPIFVQETVLDLPEVYINAGMRGVVMAVAPEALKLVSTQFVPLMR